MHASRQGANERTRRYLLIYMPCLRTCKRNRKSMPILLSQRYAYALLRILLRTNRLINKYLWPYLALSGYIWPQKRDLNPPLYSSRHSRNEASDPKCDTFSNGPFPNGQNGHRLKEICCLGGFPPDFSGLPPLAKMGGQS